MASKTIYPFTSKMSINNEITNLLGDICFKLGKLEKTKQGNLDLEIVCANVVDYFAMHGIEVSRSIQKAMIKNEDISSSTFVYAVYNLNKKLPKIDVYETDFFKVFKEIMGDNIASREEKTLEGISYPIPSPSKLNNMMKSIFNYVSKSKNRIHPLLASATIYFSILTIAPLKEHNNLLALSYAKAILMSYSKTFSSIRIEKALLSNKINFDESLQNSIFELDQKYFAEEYLQIVSQALLSLMKGRIKSNKQYSNFVDKLLDVMEDDVYYTTNELTSRLGLKSRLAAITNYIKPAIEAGKVVALNPLSPRDRNQKYRKENN